MCKHNSLLAIGAMSFAFALCAQAQIGVDVEGAVRAAEGVNEAGRGVGAARVGGTADAAAGVNGGVRGLSDAELSVSVQAAISQELRVPGVRSDVHNGVATLSGTVTSDAERERAEQVARRVDGVTRVRNDLIVAGAANAERHQQHATGAALDAAVVSRIRNDSQLAARDIAVSSRGDVVTLTGEVASAAEKESAGRIAADAAAGATVRNQLEVRGEN
jgi:osmotically-inducible protein OsmY